MKKKLLFSITLCLIGFLTWGQTYTWNPEFFSADQSVTLTVSDFDPQAEWGVSDIYLWSWHFDANGVFAGNPTATGTNFNNSPETAKFEDNGDGTYTFDFGVIQDFFNDPGITQIGYLIKSQNGSGQTVDAPLKDVGIFQVTLNSPNENQTLIVNSGSNLSISATNTNGNADYVLSSNGSVIDTQNNISSYSYDFNNITSNQFFSLDVTQNATTITKSFSAIVNPGSNEAGIPTGLNNGINYNTGDATKATLVLDAPLKDFVYIAGSFNNWQPTSVFAMKKDPNSTKFWLELSGLTPGQLETYQYWVLDETPIANSPTLVKTADPFSTLVLSPFDDGGIPESSFPNLPAYPSGQEREVTVLQTGQTPYDWQFTNFIKPKKEDLIIYEVLIRDFDANRNYQDLIDRMDYFKNLNINAIQLMPIMEYDGNESWGYNTGFHMALDKYYGTPDKFKEFVDLCHQNGIAVILDIALNHATGRNPLVRMWMEDPDGDGWGGPSSENPYFNTVPQHNYNVFNDFNHQSTFTKDYTESVVRQWIEEYKIDGFRWDLTKGFTQNCGPGSLGNCTDSYQQDRVDVLKSYANYSWSLDETHYVIFEHLGQDGEEQQWANYRLNESVPKGIMMWGKMTSEYTDLAQGFGASINRMGHESRGFNEPRLIGYPESHDEERVMYEAVTFGNNSNPSHNVRDLNTALSRISAIGAVSTMIPGPKMIWHFADLGMDDSIWTCSDGVTVQVGDDGCKLATKPQPQWTENWLSDALRSQIYEDWSKLHKLKIEEPVFEGDYNITGGNGNLTQRIDIFDTSIPTSQLRNVIIYANLGVTTLSMNTDFPNGVTSTWYDLMDPTGNTTVSDLSISITIPSGQFRILGNVASDVLSVNDSELSSFNIYPNPSRTSFSINTNVSNIGVYDLTGKLVKSFKGDFTRTDIFDISNLNTGMYLVKVENNNNQTMTTKLVKL